MLLAWTIGWLVGLIIGFEWPLRLVWPLWLQAAIAGGFIVLILWRFGQRRGRFLPWIMVGFGAWAGVLAAQAWGAAHPGVPQQWLLKPVEVEGMVVSLPETVCSPCRTRFALEMERVRLLGDSSWTPYAARIRLTLYPPLAQRLSLQPGERWRLTAKLKPVHGWANPAGFDYERWAFSQGWQATGYVRQQPVPRKLGQTLHWQRLRAALYARLAPLWEDSPYRGLYEALLVGVRQHISPEQWRVLQQTGTAHLMAISGLHLGAIAALGGWLFAMLWNRWRSIQTHVARVHFAWWGALGLATVYLFISGAALPALRAWTMLWVVAIAWMRRRVAHPWSILALAALLITLWHPPSVLGASFWLSFSAAAIIFALLQHPRMQDLSGWKQAALIQLALLAGMAPLTLGYFDTAAGLSGLANFIAVPFVMFVALPTLSILSLLHLFSEPLAQFLWPWWESAWHVFWQGLEQAARWHLPALKPMPLGIAAGLTLSWMLAISGRNARLAAIALPALLGGWLLWPVSRPAPGTFEATVLDVGQGQALVIETAHRVLVYDSGPRHGVMLDAGRQAIAPFLRMRRWSRIDRLIVSHSDLDHAGGAPSLRALMPTKDYLSGQPDKLPGSRACHAGQRWSWDGVTFEILWPPPHAKRLSDNAASCVLKVSAGDHALLAAGDLPSRQEKHLARTQAERLRATLLIATHHGSRSSNSAAWLDAVLPQRIAVSAGFANRFRHPAAAVKARWLRRALAVDCTGCDGAIRYVVSPRGVERLERLRRDRRTIYRHQCRSIP